MNQLYNGCLVFEKGLNLLAPLTKREWVFTCSSFPKPLRHNIIGLMNTSLFFNKTAKYLKYYPWDIISWIKLIILNTLHRIKNGRPSDPKEFIQNIYKCFMKGPPSDEEVEYYSQKIQEKGFSGNSLVFSFLMLPARLERRLLHGWGMESHHLARLKLVRECLPKAEIILDIGGASGVNKEGALMGMGYPHTPKEVHIVDTPPGLKTGDPLKILAREEFTTGEGTKIIYHYKSMTDLSHFPENFADLAWSGQSIEHITEHEARGVMSEVFRILKPGACFCLDTPNRGLTLLQTREGFVHPEHKIEYHPEELIKNLEGVGFKIIDKKAVSPMPFSLRSGRFGRLELLDSKGLGPCPGEGYSFFLSCVK